MESDARAPSPTPLSAGVPTWRHQPYRVLFPLGALIAAAGVGHWWLHGLGVLADYRPVFHAIAQIQGFLLCFALGFLFTAIPRRTGTAAPAAWEMAIAIVAPIGTAVSAWFGQFAWSQVFWFVLVAMLLFFIGRRFFGSKATRRPPVGFVWVPISFLMGLAGSVMIGIGGMKMDEYYNLHELGRLYLLQGLFLGLIVGVGSLFLPLVTRGQNSKDITATPKDMLLLCAHLLAAATLALSFWIENSHSLRGGFALRSAVVFIMLVTSAGILRPPTVPGMHRWFLWLSAWMLPLGYAIAAVFPGQKNAGMHVVFIGGFALMTLSVGMHVTLAHGGRKEIVRSWVWQVPLFGGLLFLAMVLRGMLDVDPDRFFFWLKWSAGIFLLGLACWASLVLPNAWGRRSD